MALEWISRPDAQLAARVRGDGPVVVLLHGFPDTFETWCGAGEETDERVGAEDHLVREGYRTVALALRGYAPSEPSANEDYSLRALAEDPVATLDHFNAERGLVVGHDWGASVRPRFTRTASRAW